MLALLLELGFLALATTSISITVTKAKVFDTPKRAIEGRWSWIDSLLNCPYCFSHWVALTLMWCSGLYVMPEMGWFLSSVVTWFSIVTISALLTGCILRLMYVEADEVSRLRHELAEARAVIQDLLDNPGGPHAA